LNSIWKLLPGEPSMSRTKLWAERPSKRWMFVLIGCKNKITSVNIRMCSVVGALPCAICGNIPVSFKGKLGGTDWRSTIHAIHALEKIYTMWKRRLIKVPHSEGREEGILEIFKSRRIHSENLTHQTAVCKNYSWWQCYLFYTSIVICSF
jgi:hypothetical protein